MTSSTMLERNVRDAWHDPVEPAHMRLLHTLYWRALIMIAAGMLLAAMVIGYIQLQHVLRLFDDAAAPVPKGSSAFSQETFNATVGSFDTRKVRYESLKTAPITASDPSR